MQRSHLALVALLALGAVPFAAVETASATQIDVLDLRALVRASDHVVVGTVVRTVAHLDGLERIVTDAEIRVEERLHGPARAGMTVRVRRLGGVLGDVGMRIEGEPTFIAGERLVLFARTVGTEGILRPVGMSQGVLPIERRDGAEQVLPGGEGLTMVAPGPGGALEPSPGALVEPRGIDGLLAEIRSLVAELHGGR